VNVITCQNFNLSHIYCIFAGKINDVIAPTKVITIKGKWVINGVVNGRKRNDPIARAVFYQLSYIPYTQVE
jgi:hypothetical protein